MLEYSKALHNVFLLQSRAFCWVGFKGQKDQRRKIKPVILFMARVRELNGFQEMGLSLVVLEFQVIVV